MPQCSSSHSTALRKVWAPRPRTLEDDETIPSKHSFTPNRDPVAGTENANPIDLTTSAQVPTTNGLGKFGLKRMNDDEEEDCVPLDLSINLEKPLDLSTKVGPRNRYLML